MSDAVEESFEHWYGYIVDSLPIETTRALKIKNAINLVQLLLSDLSQGCAAGQILFKSTLDIDYVKLAFMIYQKEVRIARS